MTDSNAGNMRVSILTDAQNRSAGEFLDCVFDLKTRTAADPGFPKYHRDAVSSTISDLATERDRQTLTGKFNQGDQIIAVSWGVPGRPDDYARKLHALLDVWSEASHKPVLLIISENSALTQNVLDSWAGWEKLTQQLKQPLDVLKGAVKVSQARLGDGFKILDAIRERAQAAHTLQDVLSIPQTKIPSSIVERPAVTSNTREENLNFKPLAV